MPLLEKRPHSAEKVCVSLSSEHLAHGEETDVLLWDVGMPRGEHCLQRVEGLLVRRGLQSHAKIQTPQYRAGTEVERRKDLRGILYIKGS